MQMWFKVLVGGFALFGFVVGLLWLMLDVRVTTSDAEIIRQAIAALDYHKEEIAIAGDLGRLDMISFMLGLLGIGVGFFAIISYVSIRHEAISEAKKAIENELKPQLKELTERTAREYYQTFMDKRYGEMSPVVDVPDFPKKGNIEVEKGI